MKGLNVHYTSNKALVTLARRWFLFQVCQLATKIKPGFPSKLFWHFTTEKHQSGPVGLLVNAYLVVWKVGVTHTYANRNEEKPGGFAVRIFKDSTIERL